MLAVCDIMTRLVAINSQCSCLVSHLSGIFISTLIINCCDTNLDNIHFVQFLEFHMSISKYYFVIVNIYMCYVDISRSVLS